VVRVRRLLTILLALTSFVPDPHLSHAQQARKTYRIGYLAEGSASGSAPLLEAFRQGLGELGYIEGKNIIIEPRWGDADHDRLPVLAAELVRINVDIIVAAPTPPALAAYQATRSIPIVVAHMSDPVEAGLVENLARPGGNVTGLRSLQAELAGKRIELLKDAFPNLFQIAVLGGRVTNLGAKRQMSEMEAVAQALGLELRPLDWKRPNPDFQHLSRAIAEMGVSGLTMVSGPWQLDYIPQILDLSAKNRLPAIYARREFTEAGGLMSYSTKLENFYRRAAVYVDKILKGAKPADLPIEQPTKFEFVINLKTAKTLGLTIPPQMLMDADSVIK
jgi:putative tryptophan/tyrosine transport system substrate-binding protein